MLKLSLWWHLMILGKSYQIQDLLHLQLRSGDFIWFRYETLIQVIFVHSFGQRGPLHTIQV